MEASRLAARKQYFDAVVDSMSDGLLVRDGALRVAIRAADGSSPGVVAVFRDITEMARLRTELRSRVSAQ